MFYCCNVLCTTRLLVLGLIFQKALFQKFAAPRVIITFDVNFKTLPLSEVVQKTSSGQFYVIGV